MSNLDPDKSRMSLTLKSFVALICTIVLATISTIAAINNFTDKLTGSVSKLQRTVDGMAAQQWRIDDQIEYTHDLERFNSNAKLRVPNPRMIIRQRIQSSAGAESGTAKLRE